MVPVEASISYPFLKYRNTKAPVVISLGGFFTLVKDIDKVPPWNAVAPVIVTVCPLLLGEEIVVPPLLMKIEVKEVSKIVVGKVTIIVSVVTILELIVKLRVPMLTALTILLKVVKDPTLMEPTLAVTAIPVQSDIT